jgi:DNA replication licensing factor MCM3
MIDDNRTRIIVNINDLRTKNPKRTLEYVSVDRIAVSNCNAYLPSHWFQFRLLKNAFEEQIAFQKALLECVSSVDPTYAADHDEFYISFEGSFGNKHVTPRTLTTRFLGNMVCVEGIVTRCRYPFFEWIRAEHRTFLITFLFCRFDGVSQDREKCSLLPGD